MHKQPKEKKELFNFHTDGRKTHGRQSEFTHNARNIFIGQLRIRFEPLSLYLLHIQPHGQRILFSCILIMFWLILLNSIYIYESMSVFTLNNKNMRLSINVRALDASCRSRYQSIITRLYYMEIVRLVLPNVFETVPKFSFHLICFCSELNSSNSVMALGPSDQGSKLMNRINFFAKSRCLSTLWLMPNESCLAIMMTWMDVNK